MTDPLFICKFEGGHETCTAVFCPLDALDFACGVELARGAYRRLYRGVYGDLARNEALSVDERDRYRKLAVTPAPAIVCARFDSNGKVLATYDTAALAEFAPLQQWDRS
jgi:hypothetical protein